MGTDEDADEVFCRSCGEPIRKEAEICPECGVRNAASETSPEGGDVDIEGALRTGFERTKARSGLLLVAAFFVIQLLSAVASQSSTQRALEQTGGVPETPESLPPFLQDVVQQAVEPGPLALSLPEPLITLLSLTTTVASIVAAIVAYRVFASDERETVPEAAYKRNIGMATLNGVVASFVFGIVVALGLFALIVPGIYLITALLFFLVFVALEDESFIDSLSSSWEITKGRRTSVFLLLVALLVVQVVVAVVGGVVGAAAGAVLEQLGAVVEVAVGAVVAVYTFAVITEAYLQLRGESDRKGAA